MSFTYKTKKYSTRLFIACQAILDEGITAPQLSTAIRLITQNMEKIFDILSDFLHAKKLIADIIGKESTIENILQSMESYPLKQSKQDKTTVLKQSALIHQFGLVGEKSSKLDLSGQEAQRSQALKEAVIFLWGLLQEDKTCYIKYLPTDLLPSSSEERDAILKKLMPEIKNILYIHIMNVISEINTWIIAKAMRETGKFNKDSASSLEEKPNNFVR